MRFSHFRRDTLTRYPRGLDFWSDMEGDRVAAVSTHELARREAGGAFWEKLPTYVDVC